MEEITHIELIFENVEGVKIRFDAFKDFYLNITNHSIDFSCSNNNQYLTRTNHADVVSFSLLSDAFNKPSLFDFSNMHFAEEDSETLLETVQSHLFDWRDISGIIIHSNMGQKQETYSVPWADDDWQSNTYQRHHETDEAFVITISKEQLNHY